MTYLRRIHRVVLAAAALPVAAVAVLLAIYGLPPTESVFTASSNGDLVQVRRAFRWGICPAEDNCIGGLTGWLRSWRDSSGAIRVPLNGPSRVGPDMRNLAGWTPLMNAAFGHRREVVEFLLDQGPNVNAADPWGCTALGRAAGWPGGSDTVRILLSHGANPNVWDSSGHTPLHDAVTRGDVETAQLLIDNGADVNAESSTLGPLRGVIYEGLPETQLAMVRLLLAAGAKVNPQITFNDPPLVMAASRGLCDVAQVLIDAGADVNVCGEQNTPLCAAVRGGKMEMIDLLLAAKGIKVNARNRYRGQTALHCAAMWKTIDPAVIARLLAHGADIKLTDESGQTAADLAEESGRHDLAARLR